MPKGFAPLLGPQLLEARFFVAPLRELLNLFFPR